MMENKVKNYEAPSIEMLSICIEGVLCLSRSYNSQGLKDFDSDDVNDISDGWF